jgi:hypothetical protein
MKKPWILALLVLAVLADLALTFYQNYQLTIDGDLAAIVVPRADYAQVLHDPFGWAVLTKGGWYSAPNRFFAHVTMRGYCLPMPLLLQSFLSPITSAYAALALLNTGVQALLLYVLAWYATGTRRLGSVQLWLAMALMAPFFQTTGYNGQMSVVDNSVTYTFFYALPLLLLLVLLWPLYRAARQQQPLREAWPQLLAMLLLVVVLAFNGPLITGTVLVLLLGVGLHAARQRQRLPAAERLQHLPWQAGLVWGWLGVLCLYSLYIGRHNSENLTLMLPLWERYQLVPLGIWDELTSKLGLPLLVLGCIANVQLIRRQLPPTPESQRIVQVLRYLGWFALVYTLLLPLGGYRNYRPLILRHDSILPITLGLIGFYALSATYLLGQLRGRPRQWYTLGVVVVAFIFTNADRKLHPNNNNVDERQALVLLSQAGPAPVVRLPKKCRVLSWDPITSPNESLTNAELLEYWGITQGRRLYYYPDSLGQK